ncbi:MAG: hypothetical protein WCO96_09685 [Actinomycetes bacterium]
MATASWSVDATPPAEPVLSDVPSSPTSNKTASISFSSEPAASFTCSVDGSSYSACSSPKALSALSDGAHSIAVKATDSVGNVSAAATAAWTVDTVGPAKPVLSGAPSGYTSDTDATIAVSAETGASLECSVDSGKWDGCASPVEMKDLTEAAHSLEVRATDPAGNTSDVTKTEWTVDRTAPALAVSGSPKGTVNTKSAAITFTVEQADSVKCSIDDGPYTDCSSPIQLTDLADGVHRVAVKASDAAGNKALVVTDSWTVNTAKPAVPDLRGAPPAVTGATAATIAFTGATGSVFRCSTDGGSWADCDSPVSMSGLTDGLHSVSVKQVNAAGTESNAATASWRVDTIAPAAPVVALTSPSGVTTTQATASFTYSGEPGATALCSVDGAAFAPCGNSPVSLTGLAFGSHTVVVKLVDAAGNVSDTASRSWQIEVPAPVVLTPSASTKTVTKKTVNGAGTWAIRAGLLFSRGGDTRSATELLTVQVAVDSAGRPVSTKPSDALAPPTVASFTNGVLAWPSSGELLRASIAQPVWIRVGNRAGRWSAWAKLVG